MIQGYHENCHDDVSRWTSHGYLGMIGKCQLAIGCRAIGYKSRNLTPLVLSLHAKAFGYKIKAKTAYAEDKESCF